MRQSGVNGVVDLEKQAAGRSLPITLKGVDWGRKVRTPQGSVPDNVRDGSLRRLLDGQCNREQTA